MSDDDRLGSDLRAAAGRDLPGEDFDRRVMTTVEGGGGERSLSVPVPGARWRGLGLAATVALVLLGVWAVASGRFRREGTRETPETDLAAGVELPPARNGGPWPRPIRIAVTKDAKLRLDGVPVTLDDLVRNLGEATRGTHATGLPLRPSLRFVVILADRRIRWREVQWVMQACADPSVRLYRLNFAVTGPGGDRRILPATLPVDRGLAGLPFEEEVVEDADGEEATLPKRFLSDTPIEPRLTVRLEATPAGEPTRIRLLDSWMADEAALIGRLEALVKIRPGIALEFDATAEVPFEEVARVLDAWTGMGGGPVTFRGAPPPKPR